MLRRESEEQRGNFLVASSCQRRVSFLSCTTDVHQINSVMISQISFVPPPTVWLFLALGARQV